MVKNLEEYKFPFCKRRKLVNLFTEAGFVFDDNSHGQHIYVAHPKEDHKQIEGHHLPVGFLRISSYTPLNLDESSLKEYHDKLREIYLSVKD